MAKIAAGFCGRKRRILYKIHEIERLQRATQHRHFIDMPTSERKEQQALVCGPGQQELFLFMSPCFMTINIVVILKLIIFMIIITPIILTIIIQY